MEIGYINKSFRLDSEGAWFDEGDMVEITSTSSTGMMSIRTHKNDTVWTVDSVYIDSVQPSKATTPTIYTIEQVRELLEYRNGVLIEHEGCGGEEITARQLLADIMFDFAELAIKEID